MADTIYDVEFTPESLADLENIIAWIAQDSPESAQRVASEIVEAARSLSHMPLRGAAAREKDVEGVRMLQIIRHSYRIVYSIGLRSVTVHFIIHAARAGKQR